jgi:hypothetical protein
MSSKQVRCSVGNPPLRWRNAYLDVFGNPDAPVIGRVAFALVSDAAGVRFSAHRTSVRQGM